MELPEKFAIVMTTLGILAVVVSVLYTTFNKDLKKIPLSKSTIDLAVIAFFLSVVNLVVAAALFFDPKIEYLASATLMPILNFFIAGCIIWEQRSFLPKKTKKEKKK